MIPGAPLMLFRSAPYIVIALLIVALTWMTNLYLGKRDQIAALTASVQSLGQAAEKVVEDKKAEYAGNLDKVKEDHENLIPAIRANAVDNYIAANPERVRYVRASCRPVPGATSGLKLDAGEEQEPLLDITLIEEAASDAAKLAQWQQWAALNHLPVKD